MQPLKLFGIVLFLALLPPSQGILSGLSCAVSPRAMQQALSKVVFDSGLFQKKLQGLVLPNILGEGGLLNPPTVITGLQLDGVWLPTLAVAVLPGVGLQLSISAQLEFRGNCLVGLLSEVISITADVTITANIKCTNFELGAVQVVVDDCFCILGAVKIGLLSGLLSISVNTIVLNQLTTIVPSLVTRAGTAHQCSVMVSHTAVFPIGTKGTVHYHLTGLPFASGSSLGMDLDGTVQQAGGSIVPHHSYSSAMPPLLESMLLIGLRPSFLSSLLFVLLQIQPQTFPCSTEAFSGANQLRDAIIALFPSGCSSCSPTAPLSIHLECVGKPIMLLETNKATVNLSVMIGVFTKRPDSSSLTVLLVKADISLDTLLSIVGGSLVLRFSLGSTSLSLESSDVGIIEISKLKPYFISLLVEIFLPLLNAVAAAGLPLPKVFNIPLLNGNIRI
ncbi:BPIB4 protein, partial [Penelope pileata]|nr:BPIB4 protein [Penelope pileata]